MKLTGTGRRLVRTCVWLSLLGLALLTGCTSSRNAAAVTTGHSGKSGSQLWAENCGMCHKVRSPGSYSPEQWEVAANHMRYRGGLTAVEEKKIAAFLKGQ
jgi:cytochrome c5